MGAQGEEVDMTQPIDHAAPLEELRRRRAELRQSMSLVEFTIAAPVREDTGRWLAAVTSALEELEDDFKDHIEVTEGPKGLYQDLQATAPRLSRKVGRLTAEHQVLREMLADLHALIDAGAADDAAVTTIREHTTALLGMLSKHRARGSDMVWEAYAFDVGGET
jgi:hypothetical protein